MTDTIGLEAELARTEDDIDKLDRQLKGGILHTPSQQEADKLINERMQLVERAKTIKRQIQEETAAMLPRIGGGNSRREEGIL